MKLELCPARVCFYAGISFRTSPLGICPGKLNTLGCLSGHGEWVDLLSLTRWPSSVVGTHLFVTLLPWASTRSLTPKPLRNPLRILCSFLIQLPTPQVLQALPLDQYHLPFGDFQVKKTTNFFKVRQFLPVCLWIYSHHLGRGGSTDACHELCRWMSQR